MVKVFRWRVVAILLVFVAIGVVGILLVGYFPPSGFSSYMQYGSGTEEDPYRIYNVIQFNDLMAKIGYGENQGMSGIHFKLMRDIVYENTNLYGYGFAGVFNGNGKTIRGIRGPVFRYLESGGVIKNLNVEGDIEVSINNTINSYGAISGVIREGGTISNCVSSCNFILDFSSAKRNVMSSDIAVGGIAGANYGIINECVFNGSIVRDVATNLNVRVFVGGIAAVGYGVATNCTAAAHIDYKISEYRLNYFGIAPNAKGMDCSVHSSVRFTSSYDLTHSFAKVFARRGYYNFYLLAEVADGGEFDGVFIMDFNGFSISRNYNMQLVGESSGDIVNWGKIEEVNAED